MGNIPIVAEKRESPETNTIEEDNKKRDARYDRRLYDGYLEGIPVEQAQKLIDEATTKATYKAVSEIVPKVADEAANRAISSYIQANKQEPVSLNIIDRKGVTLSQQEYERLIRDARERVGGDGGGGGNTISLGRRFEDAFNQRVTDELIGNTVSGLFRGGNPAANAIKSHSGIIGAILDIADTKMGYGFGQQIGDKATELVKMFGEDRIGAMMDAASGRAPSSQQQSGERQLTPEEQQKKIEIALMSFDSTNINDMAKFMEATGIKSLPDAQRALLTEQDKILQGRGLTRKPQEISPENVTPNESPRTKSKNRQNDMNRDLIDKYDNPGNQTDNMQPPRNDFFETNSPPNMGFQQSPEEIILSLNPDEPSSIHKFMAMRGIVGVEQSTVKKMLMKEQKSLLSNPSNHIQEANQSNIATPLAQDEQVVQGTIITPEEDERRISQSRILSGNEYLVTTPHVEQKQQEQPKIQQINIPLSQNKIEQSNTVQDEPINSSNSENSLDTIMKVLNKLDKKIDSLEFEIDTIKKSNKIRAYDFTDVISSEEPISVTKTVNVDTLTNKSPRTVSLNDVTKEGIEDDIFATSVNDSEIGQENTRKKDEIETNVSEPKIEDKKEENSKLKEETKPNEEIDWWGDRKDLLKNNTDEINKTKETNGTERRKFSIKRK